MIDRGTIVIRGGLIADVGATATVPAGATVIDGKGLTVYPGLFDAATGLGLSEVPGIVESDDFSDLGEFMPQLMAFHAFHIDSVFVANARSAGILHVVTNPSGGMLAGQGAVMALAGWTADEMELARHGPLTLDFPKLLNYEASAYTRRRHPYAETKDYATKMRELTEFFAAARRYLEAKERPAGSAGAVPARDARYEAMIPVLKGQQPVFIEVQSDQDIRKAVEFAKEQKLNYALVGADDAPKVADFLRENGVRLILGLPGPLPIREDDPVDGVCRAAATLHERGVSFAFGTGGQAADIRSLRHDVGMAVACGLPYDVALRSVTLTPAEFVGVAGQVGSIEKGKRANLVLTDGDIFEYGTHIKQTFVNGAPAGVESRYTDLYKKYKDRR
ncbi:MAG: amidohydrolase family protein [Acidobacteria bacterium]|nr:amidohydrolase family protein [Acidobacteriota bacterium]